MASFWDMLGQAASVMQLTGVDGIGIASMIIQAARTVSRNKDLCQQLANRVQIVSDLLRELQIPELRRNPSTRRPLDQLRKALFCAYMLVWSCGQQQQNTSPLYQLWKSADIACRLRDAKEEIDSYINLIPMVTAVASVKARGTREVQDTITNYPDPPLRPQLSTEEVTDSLQHEVEWQPIEHVRDLVSMIAESAGTAHHNRDQCRQLAQRAQIATDQLQGPFDTQRALEQLEEILFRTYMLICFFSQYNRTQLQRMFTGADVDSVFLLAQDEISSQIILMTDHVKAEEPHDDVTGNYQEQDERTHLYLQDEVTEPHTAMLYVLSDTTIISDVLSEEDTPIISDVSSEEDPVIGELPISRPSNDDQTILDYEQLSTKERLGFGTFYRGSWNNCYHVAIKRFVVVDELHKYFRSRVSVFDHVRLSHRNLVRFVGSSRKSTDDDEVLLVYELMPNGSLDTHLYDSAGGGNMLPWPTRYKIILGVGSALLYMHHESHPPVVHGNVKPSNVMLDSSFNAKLGDFWLPSLMGRHPSGSTMDGYRDSSEHSSPYIITSEADDVYGFGILLLEVACGRRPIFSTEGAEDDQSSVVHLARWVLDLYARDALLDAADPRLAGECEAPQQIERVLVVGLWCAHPDNRVRPSIWQAMRALQRSEVPLPNLPKVASPQKEDSNVAREQARKIAAAAQLFPAGGERRARDRRPRKSHAQTPGIIRG